MAVTRFEPVSPSPPDGEVVERIAPALRRCALGTSGCTPYPWDGLDEDIRESWRRHTRAFLDEIGGSLPSPPWRPGREAVARIVDPIDWARHDSDQRSANEIERLSGPSQGADRIRADARELVAPSLAKADAILALEPEDSRGSQSHPSSALRDRPDGSEASGGGET